MPYLRDLRAIVTSPINQASPKKGIALSHMQIATEETSSGWNHPAFNLYLHTYIYILSYFHQNKMIKFLGSLLLCI